MPRARTLKWAVSSRSRLQERLMRDLQQRVNNLDTAEDRLLVGDRVLTDLFTMLGSVRGLIAAMGNAQGIINQINWQQWAAARF